MALLELKVELARTNDLLERLVVAVERAVGPLEFPDEERRPVHRTEPQDIGRVRNDGAMKHLDRLKRDLEAGRGK